MLVLSASSDVGYLAQERRIRRRTPLAPAAVAMRRERAEIAATSAGDRRREHARGDGAAARDAAARSAQWSSRACASSPAARWICSIAPTSSAVSLSSAIENMLLLDDVMRSRRELENTFDSIAHLVVVSDQAGRIVHVNTRSPRASAGPQQELLDRPLADFVGPDARSWLAAHDGVDPLERGSRPRPCGSAKSSTRC